MNKLTSALEGGLAGAATISMLGDRLKAGGGTNPQAFLKKGVLHKKLKKARRKKSVWAAKDYIDLAGHLLEGTTLLGLTSLTKKKNAMWRGALLGTAAGLGAVLLAEEKDERSLYGGTAPKNDWVSKALEVSLYTIGGLIAGKVIEGVGKKKKKK